MKETVLFKSLKYPYYTLPKDTEVKILNEYTRYQIPQKIPYRLDYIFVGPRENMIGTNKEVLKQPEKLYDINGVVTYKYNK